MSRPRLSIPPADWTLISREARKIGCGPIELDATPDTWADYCHACFEGTTRPTPEGFVRWCRVRTRLDPPQHDWGFTGATGPIFASGVAYAYGPTSPSGMDYGSTGAVIGSGGITWLPTATGLVPAESRGFPSAQHAPPVQPVCRICRALGRRCPIHLLR